MTPLDLVGFLVADAQPPLPKSPGAYAFKWITLGLIAVLLLWEAVIFIRRPVVRAVWLLRVLIWLTAGVAVLWPRIMQDIAGVLQIGRGADLLLYVFVLAFLLTSFYFYSRYVALQRQLTQVVRHLAIREAEHGANGGPESAQEGITLRPAPHSQA
jgi:hypothetical protein